MKLKALSWRWLLVAFIPGCVLLQPLDEAKSDAGGSAGASHAGKGNAGAPSGGGAGGSGPAPSGGRGGGPPAPGGAGGGPPSNPLSAFTGIWTLTDGAITLNCGGTMKTNPLTSGSANWKEGTTSDLVQTSEGTNCQLLANVSGRVATGEPNQQCTESGVNPQGQAYTQDLLIQQYTFTVASTGLTAAEAFSGTVYYMDATTSGTCTFVQNGNYRKQ